MITTVIVGFVVDAASYPTGRCRNRRVCGHLPLDSPHLGGRVRSHAPASLVPLSPCAPILAGSILFAAGRIASLSKFLLTNHSSLFCL